jgi:hypothetical protein
VPVRGSRAPRVRSPARAAADGDAAAAGHRHAAQPHAAAFLTRKETLSLTHANLTHAFIELKENSAQTELNADVCVDIVSCGTGLGSMPLDSRPRGNSRAVRSKTVGYRLE